MASLHAAVRAFSSSDQERDSNGTGGTDATADLDAEAKRTAMAYASSHAFEAGHEETPLAPHEVALILANRTEPSLAASGRPSPFRLTSPARMLTLLNRHLLASTQPEKYATLFLACYDSATCELTYANGGQPPPLLLRASGQVQHLDRGGSVIGLLDGMTYEEAVLTLAPGDLLVLYSDGVTEPENASGEFGEERLLDLVRAHQHEPLASISSHVMQGLRSWIGEVEHPDDITLVLARAS